MRALGPGVLLFVGLQAVFGEADGGQNGGNAFMLTKRTAIPGRRTREEKEIADQQATQQSQQTRDGSVIGEVTHEAQFDRNSFSGISEHKVPEATIDPVEQEELKKANTKYLKEQVKESLKTLTNIEKGLEKEVDEAVRLAETLDLKVEANTKKLDDSLAKVEASKEELANFKKAHYNLVEQVQQLKDEERKEAMARMEEDIKQEKMVKLLERSKLLAITEKEAALKKTRLEEQTSRLNELENKMKALKKKWKVEDFNDNCPQWAVEGKCETDLQNMKNNCRKSCNITSEEVERMLNHHEEPSVTTTEAKEL